jgi:hypothetical protein
MIITICTLKSLLNSFIDEFFERKEKNIPFGYKIRHIATAGFLVYFARLHTTYTIFFSEEKSTQRVKKAAAVAA